MSCPKLKIFFAETRLGWVPFWLEHMDLWYQRHLGWAEEYLGFKPLKELPGHYVRENIYFSVQYERVAIEQRHNVGGRQWLRPAPYRPVRRPDHEVEGEVVTAPER